MRVNGTTREHLPRLQQPLEITVSLLKSTLSNTLGDQPRTWLVTGVAGCIGSGLPEVRIDLGQGSAGGMRAGRKKCSGVAAYAAVSTSARARRRSAVRP